MKYIGKADIVLSSTHQPEKGPVYCSNWDVNMTQREGLVDIFLHVADESFRVSHIKVVLEQAVYHYQVELTGRLPGQCTYQTRHIS